MRARRLASGFLLLVALTSGTRDAVAQWVTQTITLNPGWNAVYLEVQPATNDCDTVFAGLPVESVWAWNRRFSSVQFIQDANQMVPGQPDWLVHLPPESPARAARNLFAMQGSRAYLVKLKNGAGAATLSVVGQPVNRQIDWVPNSLNLVGFPVSTSGGPTFQDFFSGSPAHFNQPVYRLASSGQWQLVPSPATALLRSGESFWIFSAGASAFSGPVQITLEQRDGLRYGRVLTEQTLRIRNNSTGTRSVTLWEVPSQTPPNSSFPVLAGIVPLSLYAIDTTSRQFGWLPMPSQLQKANMLPGEEWVLRLEVNRPQMASFVPPTNHNGVLYQSILNVADDSGVRYQIAVSSEGPKDYGSGASATVSKLRGRLDGIVPSDPSAGLWVGSATINKISQPANMTSPTNAVPVGAPLQFRLIVHVDDAGNARLLQKVLQMFKPGTLKPDPNDPTHNIVDQPGRYVLVTKDSLIPQFSGATLRDGQPVARRISSAVFGFSAPILFSGNGAFGSGDFTCQINLDYDDPLNPFKHRYHPDHNNLDDRFQDKLPEGAESFTVTRQVELQFTVQDPDNLTIAGWGDDQLGGNYRETIAGLHSQPIGISGTFRLTRASTIGVLNDGL